MSIQHEDANQIHKFAHISATDPGAVGAGKAWVDTSEGEPYKFWIRNTGNTAWVPVGLGNTGYGFYSGHALRQMEAASLPPYDVPNGMIMAIYTGSTTWSPITVGQLKLMLNIYNVPDGDARPRSTHTGTQLASTISNFNSAVDERISTTFLADSVVVEGAGFSNLNGIYTKRGTYAGKPYYNLEGQPSVVGTYCIFFNVSGLGYWVLGNESGDAAYRHLVDNQPNPFVGSLWIANNTDPTLAGIPPAPFVAPGGLSVLRTDFQPAYSSDSAILRFREATDNGTGYISLQGKASVTTNRNYFLPEVTSEDGSSLELMITNGIQEAKSKTIYDVTNLGTNNTCNGRGISGRNAGEALNQWDAVYIGASSTWLKADANGSGTYPAWGLATAAVLSGNATKVLTSGTVRNDAWSWTPNGAIYLSGTAGVLTQTAPATSGDKVQIVGRAITATVAYFNFNSIYTTV